MCVLVRRKRKRREREDSEELGEAGEEPAGFEFAMGKDGVCRVVPLDQWGKPMETEAVEENGQSSSWGDSECSTEEASGDVSRDDEEKSSSSCTNNDKLTAVDTALPLI